MGKILGTDKAAKAQQRALDEAKIQEEKSSKEALTRANDAAAQAALQVQQQQQRDAANQAFRDSEAAQAPEAVEVSLSDNQTPRTKRRNRFQAGRNEMDGTGSLRL